MGAGKMSELAARHLHRAGAEHIYVTNRTHERAVELASIFRGQSFPYEQLPRRLAEMDIVITSSGAPHFVITKDLMRSVMDSRKHRPTFLIDIAVPRNIEHQWRTTSSDQVFLYDIDDLQKVVEENVKGRAAKADEAEEIVRQEVEKVLLRLKGREAAPAIVQLQEQLERIRASEVERARRKLGTLSPEQEEAIEALTRGIVNKIAHGPISEIRKHATEADGMATMDLLRRAFRLDAAAPGADLAEETPAQAAKEAERNASQ
ncbi:MAG: glutamyl-tRNA reductase [Bryobacterales bacterium]|nr:glutamyl-tRNA reductase [Bryobacterales bacterium]